MNTSDWTKLDDDEASETSVKVLNSNTDYAELGRVFPFFDTDFDVDQLSPHPFQITNESGEQEMVKASHPAIKDKVPLPVPSIILQDQSANNVSRVCLHVELTDEEWKRIKDAFDSGALDPDGNGTHRKVSQASLTDLGLERIDKMLGPGRHSGSYEGIV